MRAVCMGTYFHGAMSGRMGPSAVAISLDMNRRAACGATLRVFSPWGLYNMSGNIWEWCSDWLDSNSYKFYKAGKLASPSSGSSRVLRGSSWRIYNDSFTMCAYRNGSVPDVP